MQEVWKDIPCLGGWYEASNLGRIRSWKPPRHSGKGIRRTNPRYNRIYLNETNGYLCCRVTDVFGKPKTFKVHRLVLMAFTGVKETKLDAAHINGDRLDNRAENLMWATRRENLLQKKLHGTWICGSDHKNSKLKEDQVLAIRARYAAGTTRYRLHKDYGVSFAAINNIVLRKAWHHV